MCNPLSPATGEHPLLAEIRKYNHVCWYPSAGNDYREMLFLSRQYYDRYQPNATDCPLPDLFILTDYRQPNFAEEIQEDGSAVLYNDENTRITAVSVHELQPLQMNYFFTTWGNPDAYNHVFVMHVAIDSTNKDGFAHWETDLIYVVVDNTQFACLLAKHDIRVDYIVRVRYGRGFGGAFGVYGDWLLYFFPKLQTKYFVANEISCPEEDLERVRSIMLEEGLRLEPRVVALDIVYQIDGYSWSKYGDVYWYKVLSTHL